MLSDRRSLLLDVAYIERAKSARLVDGTTECRCCRTRLKI